MKAEVWQCFHRKMEEREPRGMDVVQQRRPGPSQLRQKPAAGKVKDVATELIVSLCLGITWSLEVLNGIDSGKVVRQQSPAVH